MVLANLSWPRIRLRTSVYIEKEKRVLLILDPVYLGGCWILPGGEVEFEETIAQAAEREVFPKAVSTRLFPSAEPPA